MSAVFAMGVLKTIQESGSKCFVHGLDGVVNPHQTMSVAGVDLFVGEKK